MRHIKLMSSVKVFLLIFMALTLGACNWWPEFGIPANYRPWGEFNPIHGMDQTVNFRDQRPGGMLYPAVHSQPMDYSFDGFEKDQRDQAKALKNPVEVTPDAIALGKVMYETTCIVCHGADGQGQGLVIGEDKFNAVLPSFLEPRLKELSDGEFYHTITHGYGIMYSYKSQLKPMERWAVIHYIRTLQKAGGAN